MTTTTVSWGCKGVYLLLQVARRVKKKNHLSLPREFDINPESSLWEKLLLLYHYAFGVPITDTLKNRVVSSKISMCGSKASHGVHMTPLM
jgi:hypothetical protein